MKDAYNTPHLCSNLLQLLNIYSNIDDEHAPANSQLYCNIKHAGNQSEPDTIAVEGCSSMQTTVQDDPTLV